MRGLRLLASAVSAVLAFGGLAGSASAADPPGRGASTVGLLAAAQNVPGTVERATENISLNFAKAQDPTQPGASPGGGGGIEP